MKRLSRRNFLKGLGATVFSLALIERTHGGLLIPNREQGIARLREEGEIKRVWSGWEGERKPKWLSQWEAFLNEGSVYVSYDKGKVWQKLGSPHDCM